MPDRGPAKGSAGGLTFAVKSVEVTLPRGYKKKLQAVVLVGCASDHPNCILAKSKDLIGMEVETVNAEYLRPERGMVQQILDAFRQKSPNQKVILSLVSRSSQTGAIAVPFD
jgi:hypothetical protein